MNNASAVAKTLPEQKMAFTQKVIPASIGVASGIISHALAYQIQKRYFPNKRLMHGGNFGWFVTMLSLLSPEHPLKYGLGGWGVGFAVHDALHHIMNATNTKSITLGEQKEDKSRWYHHYHVEPVLPMEQKEAIILPLFIRTVHEMRYKPEQIKAINRIKRLAGIKSGRLTMDGVRRLQTWILGAGSYEADEGAKAKMPHGYDRWRTAAKLMDEYDNEPTMGYDCDCWAGIFAQIMQSYGLPFYIIFVSQKTVPNPEKLKNPLARVPITIHPLHHVLPGFMYQGRLWFCEGIRYIPISPLNQIGHAFKSLRRVVVVDGQYGSYYDYHDWKKTLLKSKTGGVLKEKYPHVAKYIKDGGSK